MANYTITKVTDVPNRFAERGWPGEMRFMKEPLETAQVAVSYRKMPPGSGAKGGYGHRHKTQEEIFFVLSGQLEFKLDDEVITVGSMTAVRIAPAVVRGVWNPPEAKSDAEVLIISTRAEDLKEETEMVEGFWPAS